VRDFANRNAPNYAVAVQALPLRSVHLHPKNLQQNYRLQSKQKRRKYVKSGPKLVKRDQNAANVDPNVSVQSVLNENERSVPIVSVENVQSARNAAKISAPNEKYGARRKVVRKRCALRMDALLSKADATAQKTVADPRSQLHRFPKARWKLGILLPLRNRLRLPT
jgi:hypothetical protein